MERESTSSPYFQSASNYKRLPRFFRHFAIDSDEIARLVVNWSQIPQPWTLSVDRTNWSLGTTHYNSCFWGLSMKV